MTEELKAFARGYAVILLLGGGMLAGLTVLCN